MHATAAIVSLTACDLIHSRQQRLPGHLLVADPGCRACWCTLRRHPAPPGRLTLPGPWSCPSHSSVPRRHSHGPLPLVLGTLPHWRRCGPLASCEWARPLCWPRATWRPAQSPYRGRSPRPATAAPSPCPRLLAAGCSSGARTAPSRSVAGSSLARPGSLSAQRARRQGGHHQAGGEARDRRGEHPIIAPLCPHRCPSATSRISRVQTPSLIEPACVICRWTQGSLEPHNTAHTQAGEHRAGAGLHPARASTTASAASSRATRTHPDPPQWSESDPTRRCGPPGVGSGDVGSGACRISPQFRGDGAAR
jgi:hypothetical protein